MNIRDEIAEIVRNETGVNGNGEVLGSYDVADRLLAKYVIMPKERVREITDREDIDLICDVENIYDDVDRIIIVKKEKI